MLHWIVSNPLSLKQSSINPEGGAVTKEKDIKFGWSLAGKKNYWEWEEENS